MNKVITATVILGILLVSIIVYIEIQPVPSGSFPCPYCGETFSSDVALQAHILFAHSIIPKPSYLIIVDDAFASNAKLQGYIQARSASYTVTLKTVSSIPSTLEDRTFARVSNIEGITFTSGKSWDTLYLTTNAYGYYSVLAYATPSSFIIVRQPNDNVEVCPYIVGFGGACSFTITHDGGQTITASLPADTPEAYMMWGHPRITLDGQVTWQRQRPDDIRDYILGFGASQVLLIGGSSIPGYNARSMIPTSYTIFEGMTDHPFMCRDIYGSNKQMNPTITIGRLPVRTNTELDTVLTKIANWQPHQTNKALLYEGYEDHELYMNMKTELTNLMPTMQYTELYYPNEATTLAALNSENDIFIAVTHGGVTSLGAINTQSILQLTFQETCIAWVVSCITADYSYASWRGPGETFLIASASNMVAYFGSPILPEANGTAEMTISFFASTGNLGDRYLRAKQTFQAQTLLVDRLSVNFFGDPTLPF